MACLFCKSENAETVSTKDRHGQPLITRVCTGCGQVFNDPIPSDEELTKFYSEDYRKEYKGSFRPRGRQIIRNFRRVANHIERFSDVFEAANTVLDVGAGSGEFVFAMDHLGKEARGIEPNKEYAAYCRSDLGINVETLQIFDAEFEPKSFDLINLSHVMEHLNDPVTYMRTLAEWLKDDGLFYIEVPNILSYTKQKSKGNMFHYGHIFNFSPWTLRASAGLAGLAEYDATAKRCEGITGVFFKKASRRQSAKSALNAENANTVLTAVKAHMTSGASVAGKSKFLRKNIIRVEETFTSKRLGTPAQIGKAVLNHLRAN